MTKTSQRRGVVITNTGTQALALTSDGLTIGGINGNQFVFINKPTLPTTIQPGQSLKVGVAMNANATGLKTATLTIKSNDPDEPVTVINLRGLGTNGTGGFFVAPWVGINTDRQTGRKTFDLRVMKDVRVAGTSRFQVLWEMFNVFNTTNLLPPQSNLTSAAFGRSTDALPGRIMQFGGRFRF